jgi:superfamily II DNA or RNA helicase
VRLVLTEDEAAVQALVGTDALLRARGHVERGEVAELLWKPETGHAQGKVHAPMSGTITATLRLDDQGQLASIDRTCSCGNSLCAHPEALALLVLAVARPLGVVRSSVGTRVPGHVQTGPVDRGGGTGGVHTKQADRPQQRIAGARRMVGREKTPAARPAAWESAVTALMAAAGPRRPEATPGAAAIALQFDLVPATPTKSGATRAGPGSGSAASDGAAWRVAMRPVVPGRNGWVRSGIAWSSLDYYGYRRGADATRSHLRLLREILMLSSVGDDRHYYGYQQNVVHLDAFVSRRIWDLLAEAQDMGLPLVQTGKAAGPVMVCRAPARATVQADRAGDDLRLLATLTADGMTVPAEQSILVGQPAHGVVWWGTRGSALAEAGRRVLYLAPLADPLTPALVRALASPEIVVPVSDERRFLQEYYPRLARGVEVIAAADVVALPVLEPYRLTLTVDHLAVQQAALRWQWVQPVTGDGEPLDATAPAGQEQTRDRVLRLVAETVSSCLPALVESGPTGPTLLAAATVAGDDLVRLVNRVLPRLAELDDVDIMEHGASRNRYQLVDEAPAFRFVGADTIAEADWFDLAVQLSIGGQQVPFDALFVALAQDREYLILPSGTYFSLDRPQFDQLRELIAESRALEDPPPGTLRVGRFQAGLLQELAELGEITGQARGWLESVRALGAQGDSCDRPLPQGLRATLRPYQRDGFGWLAALYEHGLGGVLADDMGLGKTLQTLALICHTREIGETRGPFLVVAPASVVHNWVSEAQRFAPDLTVQAVTQTQVRRGCTLAEAVVGADVVVTSYTLFRLEFDDYQELKWDGLVLDEAQFIKNHQAQVHRSAKRLSAPFKLAITGTPMENNLAELWALCSVTAPGLFPSVDRFTDYYRTPIEKGQDGQRLAQLQRRIKPLLLRRRKADVALDLPPKQEQVVELDLDPKHQRVYQGYLQRERQKVLGLLGDLEKNRFEIFRSLTLLRQASLDVALVDPKHHRVPSTKLDVLVEQIEALAAEGHRTLVFSQFTRFLKAARNRLENADVTCCYLDGSTRRRADVIANFKNGTAPVFLISLKAGGFGLNLAEADYCILLDPWWNPAAETQAVDRAHRIGQTRHVMVYRMVAKDTIEEKVMALSRRKAELFNSVLDDGDFSSARLTAADIQALLQ